MLGKDSKSILKDNISSNLVALTINCCDLHMAMLGPKLQKIGRPLPKTMYILSLGDQPWKSRKALRDSNPTRRFNNQLLHKDTPGCDLIKLFFSVNGEGRLRALFTYLYLL